MTNFCWGLTLYRIINDFGHFSMFGPNTKATTVLFPAVPLLQFCPLLHSRAVLWSVELGKITELPNKTENELIEKSKEAQKEGEQKELFFSAVHWWGRPFALILRPQNTVILYFAKAHFHMRLVMLLLLCWVMKEKQELESLSTEAFPFLISISSADF